MPTPPRPPRWRELTAIFGGAFDPPHLGHVAAVKGLFSDPGIGRVIVLPSGQSPLKPHIASAEHRLAMAQLAFSHLTDFPVEVDRREVDRSQKGAAPSYTFDTLTEFNNLSNTIANTIAFVLGTDQVAELPRWRRFPELLGLAHWIVLMRKPLQDEALQRAMKTLPAVGAAPIWKLLDGRRYLIAVDTQAPALSSTQIREQMALTGAPPTDGLHETVLEYIRKHRLYGLR